MAPVSGACVTGIRVKRAGRLRACGQFERYSAVCGRRVVQT